MDNQNSTTSKREGKHLKGTSYVIPENAEQIGKGSFGSVYRVYDLSHVVEDLAVKIVSKSAVRNLELIDREIDIIENLPDCVNLVKYERFCLESANNFYFIMEYCNGGDLRELMISRATKTLEIFSEAEIIDFIGQFLNGYRQLLRHQIIHRDIKPQNILICNGIYKLTDFGLSKRVAVLPSNDKSCQNQKDFIDELQYSLIPGTPMYQAPDMYQSMTYSESIDVYSLGVIVFQMLFENANAVVFKLEQQQLESQKGAATVPGQSATNNPIKPAHPLFNMKEVKSTEDYFHRLQTINAAKAQEYLDDYIKKSKVTRSAEIVDLMKAMLNVDPKQRITFQELFNHRLVKSYLQPQSESALLSRRRHEDIKEEDLIENSVMLSDKLNTSEIINLKQIKEAILNQSISICKELYESSGTHQINQNDYYQRKMQFYAELLRSKKAMIMKPDDGQEFSKFTIRGIVFEDEEQQRQISKMIALSQSRQEQHGKIKAIEDVLVFLRESSLIYRKAVEELSQSYGMMHAYDKQHNSEFVRLFDEVSLLSLFQYRSELSRIKNNIDTILLDNSVGLQDEVSDRSLWFRDEDFAVFKASHEYGVFTRQLIDDTEELKQLFSALRQSNSTFEQLFQSYSSTITTQVDIKQSFADQILMLIKRGVEEFGLIESQLYLKKFQKTLMFLVELDQLSRNPIAYYRRYNYSQAKLQFKWEQINLADDHSQKLVEYCHNANIPLIAITD